MYTERQPKYFLAMLTSSPWQLTKVYKHGAQPDYALLLKPTDHLFFFLAQL